MPAEILFKNPPQWSNLFLGKTHLFSDGQLLKLPLLIPSPQLLVPAPREAPRQLGKLGEAREHVGLGQRLLEFGTVMKWRNKGKWGWGWGGGEDEWCTYYIGRPTAIMTKSRAIHMRFSISNFLNDEKCYFCIFYSVNLTWVRLF